MMRIYAVIENYIDEFDADSSRILEVFDNIEAARAYMEKYDLHACPYCYNEEYNQDDYYGDLYIKTLILNSSIEETKNPYYQNILKRSYNYLKLHNTEYDTETLNKLYKSLEDKDEK